MDAFKLLKTDHQKVAQLFKEIESATGSGKAQLFSQLRSELDLHAHVEEKFLYPALENKEPSREITLEAYEEHKVVKDLLAELATQAINEEWDAKLKVLKENVEHHVEEEEGELFDKAEKVLSDEQIERLGVEMEAEKAAQSNENAPPPTSSKGQSTSKKAPAKAGNSKSAEKPGVLKRLANLVGIGTAAAPANKRAVQKTTKRSSKKVAKKAPAKAARKASARVAKKASAKTAAKSSAAKKSVKRQPASRTRKPAASPGKKTSKKSASRSKKSASKKR